MADSSTVGASGMAGAGDEAHRGRQEHATPHAAREAESPEPVTRRPLTDLNLPREGMRSNTPRILFVEVSSYAEEISGHL
ncbi:hypothetical protein ACDA63_19245 [Uliginosibacterium sp. sgz301328]|uniref:hypothetical protein n=1 Tax=Uliginosibacterium sp. sgz301328 TaxID=3243764 RepID=UPI00359D5250